MPVLTPHYFNVDPILCFYPASAVEMPGRPGALALQKLPELKIPSLDRSTNLVTEAAADGRGLFTVMLPVRTDGPALPPFLAMAMASTTAIVTMRNPSAFPFSGTSAK